MLVRESRLRLRADIIASVNNARRSYSTIDPHVLAEKLAIKHPAAGLTVAQIAEDISLIATHLDVAVSGSEDAARVPHHLAGHKAGSVRVTKPMA